ncbi:hypothetical protein ACFSQE_00840 [Vogesella fluminis]|uniref:hypothetical protein n=1 Tax=Vogesella fluminis TaxID=1069161 RepID=UPI003637F372
MPNLWGELKRTIGDKAEAIGKHGLPQARPNEHVISYALDAEARTLQSATIARFNELERACDGVKRTLIGRRLELALRVALVLAVWDNAGGEGAQSAVSICNGAWILRPIAMIAYCRLWMT